MRANFLTNKSDFSSCPKNDVFGAFNLIQLAVSHTLVWIFITDTVLKIDCQKQIMDGYSLLLRCILPV